MSELAQKNPKPTPQKKPCLADADPFLYRVIFWVIRHVLLRRSTWLQLREVADHGNVELRVVLAAIFQPALASSVQSAYDKALHILYHRDRNSEVSPNVYQRPLLINLTAHHLYRGMKTCRQGAHYSCPWVSHWHAWFGTAWLMWMGKNA